MSQSEKHLNQSNTNAEQPIETIYTTVATQTDQTDWLTVVSNLRQGNRQLLEQIAKLEQALATSQQSLHTHKEEKQSQEIAILQLQDELHIAQDRIGGLFQQLENSHQIGQRQQTLIETLSQQLELTQAIVPQLEVENEQLREQNQKLAEKLAKTEQVTLELHRRCKQLQAANPAKPEQLTTPPAEMALVEEIATVAATPSPIEREPLESPLTVEPALEHPHPPQTNLESRENPAFYAASTLTPTPLVTVSEVTDKESTVEITTADTDSDNNTPHWPSPKLDRPRPTNKGGLQLDLPKFPKK
jgi:hypothetical protein